MNPSVWAGIGLAMLAAAVWVWVSALVAMRRRLDHYDVRLAELADILSMVIDKNSRLRGEFWTHDHCVVDESGRLEVFVPGKAGDGGTTP